MGTPGIRNTVALPCSHFYFEN